MARHKVSSDLSFRTGHGRSESDSIKPEEGIKRAAYHHGLMRIRRHIPLLIEIAEADAERIVFFREGEQDVPERIIPVVQVTV